MSTIVTHTGPRKVFAGNKISLNEYGKCPLCDWVCKSMNSSTFSMHMSRKHAEQLDRDPLPYACSDCDKRFTARTHLNHHVASTHNIVYFSCPYDGCPYQAKNKQSLCSHYGNKHMNDIKKACMLNDICIECGKEDIISGLAYHIAICNKSSQLCTKKQPHV